MSRQQQRVPQLPDNYDPTTLDWLQEADFMERPQMTEQQMYEKVGLSQSDTDEKVLQMATYLRYHYDTQSTKQSRKKFKDPARADQQWDYICTIMLNIAQHRQSQQRNGKKFYTEMVDTLEGLFGHFRNEAERIHIRAHYQRQAMSEELKEILEIARYGQYSQTGTAKQT